MLARGSLPSVVYQTLPTALARTSVIVVPGTTQASVTMTLVGGEPTWNNGGSIDGYSEGCTDGTAVLRNAATSCGVLPTNIARTELVYGTQSALRVQVMPRGSKRPQRADSVTVPRSTTRVMRFQRSSRLLSLIAPSL